MKFKVGDKVKIKEDLNWRKKYKVLITPPMEVYKGKIAKKYFVQSIDSVLILMVHY